MTVDSVKIRKFDLDFFGIKGSGGKTVKIPYISYDLSRQVEVGDLSRLEIPTHGGPSFVRLRLRPMLWLIGLYIAIGSLISL